MAKVETMDILVAMAKAILEVAGETAAEAPAVAEKAEKPAKKEKTEKVEKTAQKPAAEDTGDADLESKTTKELYQMCVDAGIQVPKYGKNKAFYIEALTAGGEAEAPAEEAEDEDEAEDKYAGKTAKELFELCKKRGIKAAPKKKAEVYIGLLNKADEEAAAEEEADDDDWGDEEEEEEEKPAKKQQPAKPKATAKKPAKEDDDDDWDI